MFRLKMAVNKNYIIFNDIIMKPLQGILVYLKLGYFIKTQNCFKIKSGQTLMHNDVYCTRARPCVALNTGYYGEITMENTACLGTSYKITMLGWTKHVTVHFFN